jgi:hypothetical protein
LQSFVPAVVAFHKVNAPTMAVNFLPRVRVRPKQVLLVSRSELLWEVEELLKKVQRV